MIYIILLEFSFLLSKLTCILNYSNIHAVRAIIKSFIDKSIFTRKRIIRIILIFLCPIWKTWGILICNCRLVCRPRDVGSISSDSFTWETLNIRHVCGFHVKTSRKKARLEIASGPNGTTYRSNNFTIKWRNKRKKTMLQRMSISRWPDILNFYFNAKNYRKCLLFDKAQGI